MIDQLNSSHPNLCHTPADIQATLCELTAVSAAKQIRHFIKSGTVLVCGGGAKKYPSDGTPASTSAQFIHQANQ